MAAMGAAMLLVSGVAYALTVQCDGVGDQDPDPGECRGTNRNDDITGSQVDDYILDLGGRDEVTGRRGDDIVDGGGGSDEITGGLGGDILVGGVGPDEIEGGPGTPDGEPLTTVRCFMSDESGNVVIFQGNQNMSGADGNDRLDGGRDNDLLQGKNGRNVLSGNGGGDCLVLEGDENERVSGGDGDDGVFTNDGNGDDVFCGAGNDMVRADVEDRVAADCEVVIRPSALQAPGATPEAEVSIITAPGEFGS
jgi:Ca2+-binding RTX toxin-like protein